MSQNPPHSTDHAASRQLKIEMCLLDNLKISPYEQISIADMCRQMNISRRLYYTYFPDKDSCLYSLIDRMVSDSIDTLPGIALNDRELTNVTIAYLSFWQKHTDFLDVVVKQNFKALIIERSYLYFKSQGDLILSQLSTPDMKADESILWMYCAIRFVVLLQWHENHYDLTVEQMAAKYLRMLHSPIIQGTFE